MSERRPVKNIIFDLGGVLLNLDFKKTSAAFTELGIKDFDAYFTQYHADPLFRQLETGAVPPAGFYDLLRSATGISSDNENIDAAWNAMLLDFPRERIELLQELGRNYRTFLFSNTNSIHHHSFTRSFFNEFGFEFDSLFEKAWYSHLVGHRKPDLAAFQFVLADAGLDAAETLFLDDTQPNVDAALQAGMQSETVSRDNDILAISRKTGLI